MNNFKYTIMNRGKAVVSLDNIEIAREGVVELGGRAYIQYNELGKANYELEELLGEDHE